MAQVKTPTEIAYITEACRLADHIFSQIITYIKKTYKNKQTLSEIEVRDYIVSQIKSQKLRPSFPPIVTSGERAGNDIHPKPTNNKLEGFVIIDLGVRYHGYCSDMTRTVYVGKAKKTDMQLYKKVYDVQISAVGASKSGVLCSTIDTQTRINLGMYAKYFIHTLGHGVGRKIHEAPILYERYTKPILKEGIVVTIEPGMYIPNKLGIRIEDTLVVTPTKPIILTKSPKKLVVIN